MKTLIIAEAGVNHNGDIELAKKLIDVAANANVDYVKFQTFKADKLVSKEAKKAEYQSSNMPENTDENQYEMLKKLELTEEDHHTLLAYAKSLKVGFLSTGFDEDSVDFLDQLGMDFFKVPSGELTNKPYLQHIAKKGKDMVISTGMASMEEIKRAIEVITETGLEKEKISVLHCNTEYPTPMRDVNLMAMINIKSALGIKIGYSDHTLGVEVPIAAVALGAEVIEKHFTLDRGMKGPDHLASLEPHELKLMVDSIRNIEKAVSGSGIKEPSPSEINNISVARKSIHISCDISAGQPLDRRHLVMKRPGNGISPMDIDEILGKKVNQDLKEGVKLSPDHLL